MNLDNYYLHATGGFRGNCNYKNKILKVLEDNKVKITEQNRNYQHSAMNQISLCDTTRPITKGEISGNCLFSSFKEFALYSPSLIFSKDIDVIIPKYENFHIIRKKDYSDCYDEVRHIGELLLEELKFITFPLWPLEEKNAFSIKERIYNLTIFKENISVISEKYQTIAVKDIYTGNDITVNDVDRQIEIYQKIK